MTRKQAIKAVDSGTFTFDEFFIAQFGPEPYAPTVAELRDLRSMLAKAEIQQECRLTWEFQRQAARMAWNAACALQAAKEGR